MKQHWFDEPYNVRLLWRIFLFALAIIVAAEVVITLHPHFAIEALFGFHAWFGFLACAVLILAAKALGVVLKRPETYYGQRHD